MGVNDGSSQDFNDDGASVNLQLTPGVNTITANLDIEVEKLSKMDNPGENNATQLDVINGTTEEEVVLQRRVVVDPKPRVAVPRKGVSDRQVFMQFRTEDRFNSAESARLAVDGMTVAEVEISKVSNTIEGPVPDDVHGDTTVGLHVEDGRGQVTSKTSNHHVRVKPSLLSGPPVTHLHGSSKNKSDFISSPSGSLWP